MLLSLNKPRLHIYLSEDAWTLCIVDGVFRKRLLEKKMLRFGAAGSFDAALTLLEVWLSGRPEAMESRLTLGVPYVKYLMLPWSEQLVEPEFRLALAKAMYERLQLGDAATQNIAFGTLAYEMPLLASYVDQTVLSRISGMLQGRGKKLTSATPLLASILDRFSGRLSKRDYHLNVIDGYKTIEVVGSEAGLKHVGVRPHISTDQPQTSGLYFVPDPVALGLHTSDSLLLLKDSAGFSAMQDGLYAYALSEVF